MTIFPWAAAVPSPATSKTHIQTIPTGTRAPWSLRIGPSPWFEVVGSKEVATSVWSEERGRDLVDRGHDVVHVGFGKQRVDVDVDRAAQNLVGPRELALLERRLPPVVGALPGAVALRQEPAFDELVEVVVDVLPARPRDRRLHVLGGQGLGNAGGRVRRRHREDQGRCRFPSG